MNVLSYRTLTEHYSRKGAVLVNRRLSFRRRFLGQQKKLPPSNRRPPMYYSNRLGQMILKHLQTRHPKMFAELQSDHQLEQTLQDTQEEGTSCTN